MTQPSGDRPPEEAPTELATAAAEAAGRVVEATRRSGAEAQTDPAQATTALFTPRPGRSSHAVTIAYTGAAVQADQAMTAPPLSEAGLDQYHERVEIGRWEGGPILEATHARPRRRVRLRMLDADAAADPARRESFQRLIRAAAAIEDPSVSAGILEAVVEGPVPFVAYRDDPGRPMEGLGPAWWHQPRRPWLFPNERLARLLLEAAQGLEAIHDAGLLLGPLAAQSLCVEPETDQLRLPVLDAQPAPEACEEGREQDVRELAGAFYELLAGEVYEPHPGDETRPWRIARRLRRRNPGVRAELALILGRCLAGAARKRLRQARELAAAVEFASRQRVILAAWSDRLGTLLSDAVIVLLFYVPIVLMGLFAAQRVPLIEGFVNWLASDAVPNMMARLDRFLGNALIVLAVTLPYYLLYQVTTGSTFGRRIGGLRLVNASGGLPPRHRIALRLAIQATLIIGVLALLDGAARTVLEALGIGVEPARVLDAMARLAGGRTWLAYALRANGPDFLVYASVLLGLALALDAVYLTALLDRDRRPWHDRLTGITWGMRAAAEPLAIAGPSTELTSPAPARAAEPPELPPDAPTVGQYRLVRELGHGGMGTVYQAWDAVVHRPVALKRITPALEAGPEILRRFEHEAKLAARVDHPNVARLYGVGQENGRPYMVIEYLEGHSLAQDLERRGALPLADAWNCIIQAAEGLCAAHRLGIVHRDIKPSNLMRCEDGTIKVLDFGISKLVEAGDGDAGPDSGVARNPAAVAELDAVAATAVHLTRTGALLGTPLYMSPEQATGRPMDCRSDIYSLGLTLYHLLSGRSPFQGTDVLDVMRKQCHESPPPLEGVRGFTPEHAAVLDRMIAKDPAARYQTYEELLEDLRQTAPQRPVLASDSRRMLAVVIDDLGLLWLPLQIAAGMGPAIEAAVMVVAPSVLVLGVGLWGAGPGKWLLGLRVVRPDGRRVGLLRSAVRLIVFLPILVTLPLAGIVDPAIGFPLNLIGSAAAGLSVVASMVLMKLSPRRRTLHDRVADTVVIHVPRRPRRRRAGR